MTRYRWARSFIRQTRWLSIIVVIFGMAYIGFQAWGLKNNVREIAYRPNPELAQSLADVQDTLQASINIIKEFQNKTGGKQLPDSLDNPPNVFSSYDTIQTLDEADQQVDQSKGEVDSLKQFLIASVQQNISNLVSQLRAHAAAMDTSPPPSPSSLSAAPLPSQILRGLFAEDISSESAESRKQQLQQVEDLLAVLLQRTEKPENQSKIQSSIDELKRLEGLLAYLTVPADISSATTNLQPGQNAGILQPPELPAEKIADLLEASAGIIEVNLTTRWLIDDKIAATKPLIAEEERAAQTAQNQIANAFVDFYEEAIIALVLVCVLAYLMQIAADILQAHIDNAENSFPQFQLPVDTNLEN